MKAKLAATCFVAGALLVPVAGYSADTKEAPSKTESAKEVVSDSMITTKIKSEFATDKQVSAMNIKVDTDKGVVKLSGNAKSKDDDESLEDIETRRIDAVDDEHVRHQTNNERARQCSYHAAPTAKDGALHSSGGSGNR